MRIYSILPLRGLYGQVIIDNSDQNMDDFGALKFSIRYKRSRGISSKRLMGIASYYLDPASYNYKACIDVIDSCESVFYKPVYLTKSKLTLYFVQEKIIYNNSKNKKTKNL
nr:hypothetical protein [Gracilaria edulis]